MLLTASKCNTQNATHSDITPENHEDQRTIFDLCIGDFDSLRQTVGRSTCTTVFPPGNDIYNLQQEDVHFLS